MCGEGGPQAIMCMPLELDYELSSLGWCESSLQFLDMWCEGVLLLFTATTLTYCFKIREKILKTVVMIIYFPTANSWLLEKKERSEGI